MDINGILDALTQFFTTGFGQMVWGSVQGLYQILSPSNAPGIFDVPLPEPMAP